MQRGPLSRRYVLHSVGVHCFAQNRTNRLWSVICNRCTTLPWPPSPPWQEAPDHSIQFNVCYRNMFPDIKWRLEAIFGNRIHCGQRFSCAVRQIEGNMIGKRNEHTIIAHRLIDWMFAGQSISDDDDQIMPRWERCACGYIGHIWCCSVCSL